MPIKRHCCNRNITKKVVTVITVVTLNVIYLLLINLYKLMGKNDKKNAQLSDSQSGTTIIIIVKNYRLLFFSYVRIKFCLIENTI